MHHRALTDAQLLTRYAQQFADADADADYDVIVRRLGHVWDCPADGAANVVGFRCATCARTRAQALALAPAISTGSGRYPRPERDGLLDARWRARRRRRARGLSVRVLE